MCYNHLAGEYNLSIGDVKIPALPTSKLSLSLKALKWAAILVIGAIAIRYVGEAVFFLPGAIAKKLSVALTGSGKGIVTSLFFYLAAAALVLILAAVGWGGLSLQKWLAAKRSKH